VEEVSVIVDVVRVMLSSTTILREYSAEASAIPAIGDEVEIDDERYRVGNRVWSFPKGQTPAVNVVLVLAWPRFPIERGAIGS
jgi:hypothetical protein